MFIEWEYTASQIETPAAQQLISSSDDNNRSAVECRKFGVHYEIPHFHPRTTLLEWHCQEQHAVSQAE